MRPSWPGALARAVHPVRLGICLVGLAASLLLGATVQAVCAGFAFRLNDWWHDPLTEAQDLAWFLFAKGSAAAMVGGVVLVTVLWFVWSLVGGWIARSEFLRQAVTLDAGWADEPSAVTANQFLYRKGKTLLQFMPLVLSIVGFMLLPGVVAGWVNRFFGLGIGALALSVLLPVILIASLAAVLVLAGTLSCFIMPAALAAEGSDIFDVLSRGFSYVLQQPLQFAWWWGIALCLSGLPLAGVLWLEWAEPGLKGTRMAWCAAAVALVACLSLFWTLQGLVYLKMRRLVDDTPETEIWIGPGQDEHAPNSGRLGAGRRSQRQPDSLEEILSTEAVDVTAPPHSETVSVPPGRRESARGAFPARRDFSFREMFSSRGVLSSKRLALLFLGASWAALLLTVGAGIAWHVTAAGPIAGLETLHEAVAQLAGQRPLLLAVIAAAAVFLAMPAIGGAAKRVARLAAVDAVFPKKFGLSQVPLRALRPFIRATRFGGLAGVFCLTVGIELYLIDGCVVMLAFQGKCAWTEVAILGGLTVISLGVGVLGLAVLAVEGGERDLAHGGPTVYLENLLETLGAAVVQMLIGSLRFSLTLGVALATWWLTCATISWTGGERIAWLRWGLDGRLMPPPQAGLYRMAGALAGVWFVVFFGLTLVYPISDALRWGVCCYLWARHRTDEAPPGQPKLYPEEWDALITREIKRDKNKVATG